jgi:hypothetical protein
MSSEAELISKLNSLEREFDLLEQHFDQRRQILIEESKRPISRERAAQLLNDLGNLNYEQRNQTQIMKRKIEEVRIEIRQMFDNQSKCKFKK